MHRLLLAIVASSLVAVVGCQAQLSPQESSLLTLGQQSYNSGQNRAAIEHMDRFIHDYPRSPRVDLAYYLRGLARHQLSDAAGARADMSEALSRTGDKETRVKTLITLGDLAYDSGEIDAAENYYRQALADIEQGRPPADRALYRLGTSLQRQGRWEEADLQFDRLIYGFEGTELAVRAARVAHCRAWTVQAGAFHTKRPADAATDNLRRQGRMAGSVAVLDGGRPVFTVQVGRFQTYDQAVASLDSVRELQGDAFVTVTR